MRGQQLLLLFLGLVIVTAALSDVPIAPIALLLVIQSLRIRPVQGDAHIQAEIEDFSTNRHSFFASSSPSQSEVFATRSTALSEKCSPLWDLLEPVSDEQYENQFGIVDDTHPSDNSQLVEKFTKTLSLARAEGGSTQQMMDLVFRATATPSLAVEFTSTEEEYNHTSEAHYYFDTHSLIFSPTFLANSRSVEDLSRVFIHEAVHAAETFKNFKGLPLQYIARQLLSEQRNSRRYSSIFQLKRAEDHEKSLVLKTSKNAGAPYFGNDEKAIFTREYENCHSILQTVFDTIVNGLDLNNTYIENTTGMEMNASMVVKHYAKNHVNSPSYIIGPYNLRDHSPEDIVNTLRRDETLKMRIDKTNYWVLGKYHHRVDRAGKTFFAFSMPKILDNFVATFSRYNWNLNGYPESDLDIERITHIKQYYTTRFIANICPGLETFFLATNRRFKEDLIDACETDDDPTKVLSVF